MLRYHETTKEKMMERNWVKEERLKEEGRLKIIKSDMRRVSQYRNCKKDMWPVENHLADHKQRVNKSLNELEQRDPNLIKHLRIASVIPVEEVVSSFKSPTRDQL